MKKVSFLLSTLFALGFVSCVGQIPQANLKTELDTLSYATGLTRTEGLMGYLVHQVGMDTAAHMKQFTEGFADGISKNSGKDQAYLMGMQIGQNVSLHWIEGFNAQYFSGDSTRTISKDAMIAGFVEVLQGKAKMDIEEANKFIESFQAKELERLKTEGSAFLEENKRKEGVRELPSGLQYEVIQEGTGEMPKETDRVKVHYTGTLLNGTEFDSSIGRGEPATFQVDRLIPGWTEALQLMPAGSKWKLYIPYDLAYGERGNQNIPPYSTLIFEMELIEIVQ